MLENAGWAVYNTVYQAAGEVGVDTSGLTDLTNKAGSSIGSFVKLIVAIVVAIVLAITVSKAAMAYRNNDHAEAAKYAIASAIVGIIGAFGTTGVFNLGTTINPLEGGEQVADYVTGGSGAQ